MSRRKLCFRDVVAAEEIFARDQADLSNVQELRVKLIREGSGHHEGGICTRLEMWVLAARPTLAEFEERVRHLFGPWDELTERRRQLARDRLRQELRR